MALVVGLALLLFVCWFVVHGLGDPWRFKS